MVEKSSLDTPRRTESSPEKTWINGRSTSLHIQLQGYRVTTDGWRDAGKMVQLTLEVLGCASHAKKLLRQNIGVVCSAFEISRAFTLVGEWTLLLAI